MAWVLLLALHESGHALMAHLLGWGVVRVCIGTGRVRWSTRMGGLPGVLRSIPLSHRTEEGPVWSDGLGMMRCWGLRDGEFQVSEPWGVELRLVP